MTMDNAGVTTYCVRALTKQRPLVISSDCVNTSRSNSLVEFSYTVPIKLHVYSRGDLSSCSGELTTGNDRYLHSSLHLE